MASHGALGAPAALVGARGAPPRRVRVDAVRGAVAPVRFSSATENRARRPIRVVRRASAEDDDDASAFDVSEGTVWKKKKNDDDAATGDAVTGTREGLACSSGRETSRMSSLTSKSASFASPTDDKSSSIDVDALSKTGANAIAAGSASVVALALGSAAVGVTEALESVPLLQGFEEALGLAVSAYYANKLGGAFVTASGRESFRLRLVENFTKVTGSSSAPLAIAGALAKTDSELDAQISGLISDLLKKAGDGDENDAPENVKRAVARFVKERDGETRAEIDALRISNEAMRAEVDAIEMLQTDLMDARRETSEAKANQKVRVMNMEDKERERLQADIRKARAEGAAFADAMRLEMASMAADAATAAVEAEKALREERRRREEAEEKARAGAEAAAASAAPPETDAAAEAEAAAAAAAAAASLAASRREIADLKRQLAEAAEWTEGVIEGIESNKEKELREALEAAERRRAKEVAAEIRDSRDLILEERRKSKAAVEAARAEAAGWAAEEIKAYVDEARKELSAKDTSEEQFADALAAKVTEATAESLVDLARAEDELSSLKAEVSKTEALLEEARSRTAAARAETQKRVADAVANAEKAADERAKALVKQAEQNAENKLKAVASELEARAEARLEEAVASTLAELDAARAEAAQLRAQLDALAAEKSLSLDEAMAKAEAALAEETARADAAVAALAVAGDGAAATAKVSALERSLEEAKSASRRALADMERLAQEAESARRDAADARALAELAESKAAALESRAAAAEKNSAAAEPAAVAAADAAAAEARAFADSAKADLAAAAERQKADSRKIRDLTEELRSESVESAKIIEGLRKVNAKELASLEAANARELEKVLAAAEKENAARVAEAVSSGVANLAAFREESEATLKAAVAAAKAEAAEKLAAALAEAERRSETEFKTKLDAEKSARAETERRFAAASAELERRLKTAVSETETQTRAAEEARAESKRVKTRVIDLEAKLLDAESKLEAADKLAVDAKRDAERLKEQATVESESLSQKLGSTEARLVAAETAAKKASEAAEMFKAQLQDAEQKIADAAMSSRGTARDAERVSELSRTVASLETDLLAAGAATARAEAELQASLAEYTAVLATVSAREKAMAEELARAEKRATEAERRADDVAARLAASAENAVDAVSPVSISTPRTVALIGTPLVALSKMKKPELVAELVARGLPKDGIVAELRQRLRDARRRDGGDDANDASSPPKKPASRKTRKETAGPNESALKRPLSSYMLFAQATRAEVLKASPDLSVGEVGKALGSLWKSLDASAKKEWEEKAREVKAAYDVALADARTNDAMAAFETDDAPKEKSSSSSKGTSYYKVIDGVRYDRLVLDDCEKFEKVNASIDLAEARRMYEDVFDGPVKPQGRGNASSVTDVEIATLKYALATYAWDDDARAFVEDKVREEER